MTGQPARWITALVAALSAGLVAAIVTPRFGDEGEVNWLITLVVAVAAGAVFLIAGRRKVDDGAHVRDDALDR
ncbi:hypothetical protein [Rubrivirga sp.]|uniref:hypothetical protein n=1 Tax=Rubrivirga sp. TaxID=1885344 RepID=UPI003C718D9E